MATKSCSAPRRYRSFMSVTLFVCITALVNKSQRLPHSVQLRNFVYETATDRKLSSSVGASGADQLSLNNREEEQVFPDYGLPPLKERLRLVREENFNVSQGKEKIFSHFLSHIPKTGSTYAQRRLNHLIGLMTKNNPAGVREVFADDFFACDQALKHTKVFQESYAYDYKGTRCAIWMSEYPYTASANHVYTIVRNPRSHVLSQYFHCKESKAHRNRAHLMPSLDEWLETHVKALESPQKKLPKYYCYNPINHQSRFVGFDRNTTKQDLMRRYDVIGDQSQLDKSICLIFLRFTGLLPPQCDCTSRRRLIKRIDHGVTHHGDTFGINATQKAAIDKLTQMDDTMYEMAQELFKEQVHEVKRELGVVLCDKLMID